MKLKLPTFSPLTMVLGIFLLTAACEDEKAGEWLVPAVDIYDGGPGKDGIPALSNPPFIDAADVNYLAPTALIVGYRANGVVKAYPHAILDWHEIANDTVGGKPVAITYCPLTGSALAWNRVLNGKTTTFGVSGLLFNSNLIPFDRETDSYWSQMRMDCLHGEKIGELADVFQVVETDWQTWQAMYPDSRVVSNLTGIYTTNQYANYPYGSYRTDSRILFPIPNSAFDQRLHPKDRLAGVVADGTAKVYQFGSFADSVRTVHDSFGSDSLVIVGSAADNLLMIFDRQLQDGTMLNFSAVQGQLPVVMLDAEGTTWDIFGLGISGPRAGQQLDHPDTFIAYWFAWTAFYPDPEIFEFEASS